jgi:hypothetical protein
MTDVYKAHHTKVWPMKALNISKLGTKAYFNEMLWLTENLGLHELMGLRQDYNVKLVHQFFTTVFFGKSNEGDIYWMTKIRNTSPPSGSLPPSLDIH